MCAGIIRFFIAIIAVLLAAVGIVVLTIRLSLLNPANYKYALEQSKVYEEVLGQIIRFVPDENDPDHAGAYVFLGPILDKLTNSDVVKTTINNNIDNFIKYLSGEDSELNLYFPRTILINSFNKTEIQENAVNYFKILFADLPECAPDQNPVDQSNPEFQVPVCKPPGLDDPTAEQIEEVREIVSEIFGDENVIEVTLREAGLAEFDEETPISYVFNALPDTNSEEGLKTLETARNVFYIAGIAGWVLLVVSFIITMLLIAFGGLRPKNIIGTFSNVYLLTGVLVTLVGVLAFPLRDSAVVFVNDQSASAETLGFVNAAVAFIQIFIPQLFQLTLITGIVLFVICLLLRITAFMMPTADQEYANRKKSDTTPAHPVEEKPVSALPPGVKPA